MSNRVFIDIDKKDVDVYLYWSIRLSLVSGMVDKNAMVSDTLMDIALVISRSLFIQGHVSPEDFKRDLMTIDPLLPPQFGDGDTVCLECGDGEIQSITTIAKKDAEILAQWATRLILIASCSKDDAVKGMLTHIGSRIGNSLVKKDHFSPEDLERVGHELAWVSAADGTNVKGISGWVEWVKDEDEGT
jgi:hypothetical protein